MRSQPNGRFCICEIASGEQLCCFSSFFFFFLSFFFFPLWIGKDSRAVPGKLASLWITGCFPSTFLPDNVCLSLSPSPYFFRSLSPPFFLPSSFLLRSCCFWGARKPEGIFMPLSPRHEDISFWGTFPKWFGLELVWEQSVTRCSVYFSCLVLLWHELKRK